MGAGAARRRRIHPYAIKRNAAPAAVTRGHSRSSSRQPLPGSTGRPAQAEFGLGVRGRLGHLKIVSSCLTVSREACESRLP